MAIILETPDTELSKRVATTADEPTSGRARNIAKKVCVIAPVHAWDDVRVFHKECRTLANAGYDVCLIARVQSPRTVKGIKIIPAVGSSGGRFKRFLSLPFVGIQALLRKAKIYHLHNPDTIPLAVILRIAGKAVIYDTHEDFSRRILIRPWIQSWLRAPLARIVSNAESFVSKITSASIATQPDVVVRLGRNALLLGNPPRVDDDIYASVAQHAQQIDSQQGWLRAIYIGRIDDSRGLRDNVDAIRIANRETPVRLWLIGPADSGDLDRACKLPGWEYVDYLPAMAQELAFAYLQRSDVGLVVLQDVGGHADIDPNKLYEYMAFGKPFIASAFDAWMDRLSGIDAGWFVPAWLGRRNRACPGRCGRES